MEVKEAIARAIWPEATAPQKEMLFRLVQATEEGHLCLWNEEPSVLPKGLIRDGKRIYLQRSWMLETTILKHLKRLQEAPAADLFDPEKFTISKQLLEPQAEAVCSAFQYSLTVVSGGPGTGKTFTARQIIESLSKAMKRAPLRVKIAAPTGKAADRLFQGMQKSDALQIEAMTLHRLLQLRPGKDRLFEPHSIEADLILVDEASMIDASLFAHLFASIPSGARLILLGDADQLPPIGGGGIFRDLPAIQLQSSFRTQDEGLHRLFNAVRQGDPLPILSLLEPLDQEKFPIELPIFEKEPDSTALFARFDRLRWISPLRKGRLGIEALNEKLLQTLMRRLLPKQWWAVPLLITENNPALKLYNGMPAVALGRFQGGELLRNHEKVHLPDGRIFCLQHLPGFEPAFAISAHKSQGSEYDEVLCWIPPGSEEFGREALYTALTRAKRSVRIAAERETIEQMLQKRAKQENGLRERLRPEDNTRSH